MIVFIIYFEKEVVKIVFEEHRFLLSSVCSLILQRKAINIVLNSINLYM